MEYLDEKQLGENTLLIYVADNGWTQLAVHSNQGSFAERSKQSPCEKGTRTPIMFRWPSVVTPADREELCSSIDLMPTILAAARAKLPAELPGLNRLPATCDGSTTESDNLAGPRLEIVSELAKRLNAWHPVEKRKTVTAWSDQPVKLRAN